MENACDYWDGPHFSTSTSSVQSNMYQFVEEHDRTYHWYKDGVGLFIDCARYWLAIGTEYFLPNDKVSGRSRKPWPGVYSDDPYAIDRANST